MALNSFVRTMLVVMLVSNFDTAPTASSPLRKETFANATNTRAKFPTLNFLMQVVMMSPPWNTRLISRSQVRPNLLAPAPWMR